MHIYSIEYKCIHALKEGVGNLSERNIPLVWTSLGLHTLTPGGTLSCSSPLVVCLVGGLKTLSPAFLPLANS